MLERAAIVTWQVKMRFRSILAMALVAASASGQTATAANVANGERLAQRWCSSCHIVASDQRKGGTDAPPFSTIAKDGSLDGAKLAFYLLSPHPHMPDFGLTRDAASDLAAYILKQR